jgi:hypothetical protein
MSINEVQNEKELTIEELAEEVDMLIWEQGVNCFKVTEEFKKNGKRSYILHDLHIEIENDEVCCCDKDEVISSNRYNLMMFLKSSIVSIHKFIIDGLTVGEINFNDGTVRIKEMLV